MASEQAAAPFDDRTSRLWMTLSAGAAVLVGAVVAAIERRRRRAPAAGSMSDSWLQRHEYSAGQRGTSE